MVSILICHRLTNNSNLSSHLFVISSVILGNEASCQIRLYLFIQRRHSFRLEYSWRLDDIDYLDFPVEFTSQLLSHA